MWYKYKESYSYGEDKDWSYIDVPDGMDAEEYLDELGKLNTWSEHYRKVTIRKATHLPTQFILEKIKNNISYIKGLKKENRELRAMLPVKKTVKEKGKNKEDFLGRWSKVIKNLKIN